MSAPAGGARHGAARAPAFRGLAAGLALALAACSLDTDLAENMVEKQAARNARRLIDQQRQELPLPDPEVVEYKTHTAEELAVDDALEVRLVDDLLLGAGMSGPEYLFVGFGGSSSALGNVAVDDRGRFYVLETRSAEVRVFGADGRFLHQFGQSGQGPGDFQRPYGIAWVGGRLHIFHRAYFSSIWTPEGGFERDRATLATTAAAPEEESREVRRFRVPTQVIGAADGSMVMALRAPPEEVGRVSTPTVRVISRFIDGAETERFIAVPDWAGPALAMSPDGDMYVGMFGHLGTEHYIVALDREGKARFVIVSPWDPETPPRADLRVDGEGRLFVFPNHSVEPQDTRRTVTVYSPNGELIGSGWLNRRPVFTHWQVTAGEHVYGVRVDGVSAEWEVVRYRVEVETR